jgi:hypothetical protein
MKETEMNTPRGPRDLTHDELISEFESAIWADAIDEADEMGPRTVEMKEEILRRMRAGVGG